MTNLDEGLLTRARSAMAKRIDAEAAVGHARTDEQTAIRHLHLAGGSVRDIAKALGVSHQRVHQIVNATDDERGWKRTSKPRGKLACSFCGETQDVVAKLIAGPNCYICDSCVTRARTGFGAQPKCSFCGKKAAHKLPVAGTERFAICSECLDLCDEIIADSSGT